MELKVTTLDGKAAGSVDAAGRDLRPRAARGHPAPLRALAARQAPARHARRQEPRRDQPHRQEDVSAEGHGLGPSRLRRKVNLFRGGGRSFGPTPRSHAIDLPKKVRALALKHALSAKAKDGGIIVLDKATVKDGKTKALQTSFDKLGLANALIIDGAEVEANFRARRAQHPEHRRAAGAGHQRLRHPAAADAGADQGRARGVGGAVQMSTTDPRHYDVIISPVITEKATLASEQQPGDVQGRAEPRPSRRSRRRSRSSSTSRSRASTPMSAKARSRPSRAPSAAVAESSARS